MSANERIGTKIGNWCVKYPIRMGIGIGVVCTLVAFALLSVLIDNYDTFGLLGVIGTLVLWAFAFSMASGAVWKVLLALLNRLGLIPVTFNLSVTGGNDDIVDQLFITVRVLGHEHGLKLKKESVQTVDRHGNPVEKDSPYAMKNRQLLMVGSDRKMKAFRIETEARVAELGLDLNIKDVS